MTMSRFTRFSKGLIAAGMLTGSALGITGCGPDYALFKVHVAASGTATERQPIEECKMYITDESGNPVVSDYLLLGKEYNSANVLVHGCGDAATPTDVGNFSYSTSRSSGSLTFTVNALDNSGKVVQTGKVSGAAKPYHATSDEIGLSIQMTKP